MIESFTRCCSRDFPLKYGCTVNTVAPGPVATTSLLDAAQEFLDQLKRRLEGVPVDPRFAQPEEIAWTVATFCEDMADWLNGLYIPVTGGGTLS